MIIKEVTQKVLIKDGIKILDCDVVKLEKRCKYTSFFMQRVRSILR